MKSQDRQNVSMMLEVKIMANLGGAMNEGRFWDTGYVLFINLNARFKDIFTL